MSVRNDNIADVVLVVTISALILLTGVAVFNTLATEGGDYDTQQAVLLDGSDTWYRIDSSVGTDERVVDSRGYAISLTGASDSYFESAAGFEIASDTTWTVSLWGRLDSGAGSGEFAAASLNGRVVVSYNTSASEWRAWYYNESSRASYSVAVAGSQPGNLANVVVQSNGTHLSIYRNTTLGGAVALNGSGIAADPDASNWPGDVDELRTFDTAANATVRSSLFTSPVAPRPGTGRTSRAMFDQPDSATQLLFFTDTHLDTQNVEYVSGLEGNTMTASSDVLLGSGDYRWRSEGPQLYPESGGALDGAPVAYVDYDRQTAGNLESFVDEAQSIVEMGGLILVVVVLVAIVGYLQLASGRGR